MASAPELLRAGEVSPALEALMEEVRGKPADASLRTFLFQLLSVTGQWKRALAQLSVAGQMDPAALPMVQTYREALNCEALRAEVFAGNKSPLIFGDPQEWVALMVQALELSAQGHHAEAASLRAQALEAAPAVDGTIDGQPFEWLADADSRLGPLLEAVINGRYYWIPFTHARQIRLDPPEDLRDVVWMPAYFTWSNGGETVGLIPTRYAGSEASEDGRVQLARITTWDEQPGDQFIGLGQRLLATDTGDHPIMDTREISFNLEAPPAQGDDGESSEAGDA